MRPRRSLPTALLLLGGLPAQERARLPRDAGEYFPLRPGATWTYRRTQASGVQDDVVAVCRGPVAARGRRGHELFVRGGDRCRFEYWGVDEAGLWHSAAPQERSYAVAGVPSQTGCWLPAPVGIRTTWEWTAKVPPQGGSGTWVETVHRGSIADFAELTEVPAGRYRAVHVLVEWRWPQGDDGWRSELWFVPGTGPVRRAEYRIEAGVASLRHRDELVAFAPGVVEDPLVTAAAFVSAHGELWPKDPPLLRRVALPPWERAVAGQYVFASAPSGRCILRIEAGTATVLDLDLVASMEELRAAEDPRPAAARPTYATADIAAFATLYFQLRAAIEARPVEEVTFQRSSSRGWDDTMTGTFVDQHGARLSVELTGGRVTKLDYRRK